MSELITSSDNNKIKRVRNLQHRRRNRESEKAFIAEGVRLVEEGVKTQWPIEFILFDETLSERGLKLIESLKTQKTITIAKIPSNLMAEVSDTETPQGILAVLKLQALALPLSPTFLVIADQIRDPGNMGTLLRTAEAAGVESVLLTPGTVDAFSPKVVRAGMGAHFRLPIQHLPWQELKDYIKKVPLYLAAAEGGEPLWSADLKAPCALLIGGEAFGASPIGEKMATHRITIPMPGRAESLNAAIAAGILITEVLRQRYPFHRN